MKQYSVAVFYYGHVTVKVNGENEREAIELATRNASFDICHHCSKKIHFDDWDSEEPDCVELP